MGEAARILVVDDEPAIRRITARLLTAKGYSVSTEGSGEAAVAAVQRDRPDVVLLDVQMGKLSGLDVCRRIKADPWTRLVPVILQTALQAREDRIRGIEAGADDFISSRRTPMKCARASRRSSV